MVHTHIFLTETFVDQDKLKKLIACTYFELNSFVDLESLSISDEKLKTVWEHFQSLNQILIAEFENKEDFSDSVIGFYRHFNDKTLLFLGDLSSYSLPLQEGLLRLFEEPPKNLVIVIFAHNLSEILPTIISRSVVHNLSRKWVLSNLDQALLAKVKTKLPPPIDFAKNILKSDLLIPDLKKVEREELQFWLWQVLCICEEVYKQNTDINLAEKIQNILISMSLNNSNVQKKLALGAI